MQRKTTRRSFLQHTSQAAAVGTAVAALGGVHSLAAESPATVRLGIIGCGGIMGHHVKGLVSRREKVELSWLCDVDARQVAKMTALMSGFQSAPPKQSSRFEDVAADKQVDAVIIATPHHWHAPIAMAAMQDGKDVYIEKPISHVYNEGPLIIQAAQKYGRIVQQGSQMRSSPVTEKAGRLLAEGVIGEVKVARAWTAEIRQVVRPVADTAPVMAQPAPAGSENGHRKRALDYPGNP